MPERVLLKKYPNRRLYDTEKSAYVTLDQVAEMIRRGLMVEVIDAKTEENVTAFILHQIILEEARMKNGLLPVPLLHMIIQYGDSMLREFFQKYLQQTLENYIAYKKASDEQFKKWLSLGMNLSGATQKNMAGMMNPTGSFFDLFPAPREVKDEPKEND